VLLGSPHIAGRPSTKDYKMIVRNNMFPHCPVTMQGIVATNNIFSPDLGSLKGKTTPVKPNGTTTSLTPTPRGIVKRYCAVTLFEDVIYINNIPFLVTVSRNFHFGTIKALPKQDSKILLKQVKNVVSLYRQGGFSP
jgi:hypothetical protein